MFKFNLLENRLSVKLTNLDIIIYLECCRFFRSNLIYCKIGAVCEIETEYFPDKEIPNGAYII